MPLRDWKPVINQFMIVSWEGALFNGRILAAHL